MPSVRKLFGDAAPKAKEAEATSDDKPDAAAGDSTKAAVPFSPPERAAAGVDKEATPAEWLATAPSPAPPAAAAAQQLRPSGESIEVIAKHAIQGAEVKVVLPKNARFKHIKQALAKCLGNDEVLTRGQLMKKDGGIYNAFKDAKRIGDVRQVLVVCADFGPMGDVSEGEQVPVCGLREEDISDEEELPKGRATSTPSKGAAGQSRPGIFTRKQAIALQQELFEGFSASQFQRDLKALEKKRNSGSMSPSEFMQARQDLFLTVQGYVLPRFGFEGSTSGVYKMMGAMGPFVKDPEFSEWAKKINVTIGIESPPESWGDLAKSCQKLDNPPPEGPAPKAKAKSRAGGSRFGLGFGGGLGFGAPPGRGLGGLGAVMPQQAPVAVEAAPAAPPSFEPWPAAKPPPFKLNVAGTFNAFSPTEMDWDAEGGLFVCPIQVGDSGKETFQLLVDENWEKTLYPSVQDAGPYKAHEVQGPDAKGHGKNWKIGGSAQEEAKPGSNFAIVAALDSRGKVRMVDWQPF